MGKTTRQIKDELKQLPLMLSKLLGGIVAVIGFTSAVVTLTRKFGPAFENILPSLFSGCAGILVFVLSARVLARRSSLPGENAPLPANRTAINVLPWALLLLLAGIFLAYAYFLTKG